MAEIFWNFKPADEIVGPAKLMKEQGDLLRQATGGRIYGTVDSKGVGNVIYNNLDIVVPSLTYYTYTIASYTNQVISLYPGVFKSPFHGTPLEVVDQDQFVTALRDTLSSAQARNLIETLLSQA